MPNKKKFIFAGLDNVGKSSILLSFQKKFSFMDSRPTLGLKRSKITTTNLLGSEFVAWDMGGQIRFRKKYFDKKYFIFSNTSILFYIIDIQDEKRYTECLEYLLEIIKVFKIIEEKPKLIICFHKMDPDIQKKTLYCESIDYFKELIHISIPDFLIEFYNTSIHDFSTILKVFSDSIMKCSPLSKLIGEKLKEFANITFSSAIVLFSDDMLMIGNHSRYKQYLYLCEIIGPKFLSTLSEMNSIHFSPLNLIVNLNLPKLGNINSLVKMKYHEKAILYMHSFKIDEATKVNIVSLARNINTYKLCEQHIPKLAQQLSEIIKISG